MKKIGGYTLTEADERVLLNCFGDNLNAVGFIQLLEKIQVRLNADFNKAMNAYLMNDDPVTRAVALQDKGKIEFVSELVRLVKPSKE